MQPTTSRPPVAVAGGRGRRSRPEPATATFTHDGDYRPVIGRIVADVAERRPRPAAQRVADVRLVLAEACSNAAEVHRSEARDDPVVVRWVVVGRCLYVRVRDRGPGFDPRDVPDLPQPTDPRRLEHESGLGWRLITKLADAVSFRCVAGGTVVSVVMSFDAAEVPAAVEPREPARRPYGGRPCRPRTASDGRCSS